MNVALLLLLFCTSLVRPTPVSPKDPDDPILPEAKVEKLDSSVEPSSTFSASLQVLGWELPDFAYLEYLDFDSHVEALHPNLKGIYTHRHLWNHVCIFRQVMPTTPDFIYFEHALDTLARSFKVNAERDSSTDQLAVANFRYMLGQMFAPEVVWQIPETRYWDMQYREEYPSLMHIYSHEAQLWRRVFPNIECVIDLFARNYFVLIMIYLNFLGFRSDILMQEANIIYEILTDYDRFRQCGSYNTYENVLAQADALFKNLNH